MIAFRAHIGFLAIALPIPTLLIPAKTPIGGVPGLATLIYLWTGFPPGGVAAVLFLLCFVLVGMNMGWRHGTRTLYAAAWIGGAIEAGHRVIPSYAIELPWYRWGAQIIASLIMGWGLWLTMRTGYAPAGTAALATIGYHRWRWPTTLSLWLMDAAISLAAGISLTVLTGVRTFVGACIMYVTMALLNMLDRSRSP